ncbi:hypothetical protein [Herbaspirillum sp. YR522]|uniref:hypothetical protein n=1 Tax=Herbaspirillum sp. YR522 TaxID=1144342 RepID=UPI0012F86009|nr:hypothetical protein [Herbaspirillum sp. YR522]
MFSMHGLRQSLQRSNDAADLVPRDARPIQQRLGKSAFNAKWNALPPDEQSNVINILAVALKDPQRNGDKALATARFLMGKLPLPPASSNPPLYKPSAQTCALLQDALKSSAHEKTDKAADKLEVLLGSLLDTFRSAMAMLPPSPYKQERQQRWHDFLFDTHGDSALHIDLATSNLSAATKKSIFEFKKSQMIVPQKETGRWASAAVLRDNDAQFHGELYQAAFKGGPSPFKANSAFLADYVIDTIKTRPDKFNYRNRRSDPTMQHRQERDGLKGIVEDAFVHLPPSAPQRAQLREALSVLYRQDQVSTLDRSYLHHGGLDALEEREQEMASACDNVALALRDVAFGQVRSDARPALQQDLLRHMEGPPGKLRSAVHDARLLKLLESPPYLRGATAMQDSDVAAATRFTKALVGRIEATILAAPNRRENRDMAQRLVTHHLALLANDDVQQRRQAAVLEPTIYLLLQQNLISDPDDLGALAGHMRTGAMSLAGARPVIDAHGMEFLSQFCTYHRVAMLPLLSQGNNLAALRPEELHGVLSNGELLIPTSIAEMENALSKQARQQIGAALQEPVKQALLQPAILEPVTDTIKQMYRFLYGHDMSEQKYRQLMPRLLALQDYHDGSDDAIRRLFDEVAGSTGADKISAPQLAALKPAALKILVTRNLYPLAPHASTFSSEAARDMLAHAFGKPGATPGLDSFVRLALNGPPLGMIQSQLMSGDIKDAATAAVKARIAAQEELAPLQDERFLGAAATVIMSGADKAQKALRLEGLMADTADQGFFNPMPRSQKRPLAQQLAGIEGDVHMTDGIVSHLASAQALFAHVDPAAMRQAAGEILRYKDWPALVRNKVDGANDFPRDLERFEQRLRAEPAHRSSAATWGTLIERTLPFRNFHDLRRLQDGQAPIPEQTAARMTLAEQYLDHRGADPDDADDAPLSGFVIAHGGAQRVLAVDELDFLNPHNVQDSQQQHFSIRSPSATRQGQWPEEAIDAAQVANMDVPLHVRRAVIANHPAPSTLGTAVIEAFHACLGDRSQQLSSSDIKGVHFCIQKMATNFTESLPVVTLDKVALRDVTDDDQMVLKHSHVRAALLRTELPTDAASPQELDAARSNALAKLPSRLVAEMEKDEALAPMASEFKAKAESLAGLYRDQAAPHELYYTLGLLLLRLSSTEGLGYHHQPRPDLQQVDDNQSFVRFQLMGNYCLAKCIALSDEAPAAGKLNALERRHVLHWLTVASTTGECTGVVSNNLGICAPDHMTALNQKAMRVLRLASTGV